MVTYTVHVGCKTGETATDNAKVSIIKHDLEQQSKIFGKDMDRNLSEYEKQINAASLLLCQENASLLSYRKRLFELAKQKIDADGYNYKKKTSRSKVFGSVQRPLGVKSRKPK